MKKLNVVYDTIGNDKEIWLYRCKSRGEVVAVYKTVKEIVCAERVFNPRFCCTNVYNALNGKSKSFMSLNHQCKVRAIIKEIDGKS